MPFSYTLQAFIKNERKHNAKSLCSDSQGCCSIAIFSHHFCALLQHIVAFDEAVIVGYKEAKRPIYLYDSINQSRELLFQRYLTDAFLHDPFYLAI
ncbi:hypothetical protein [Pseudoalteromonas sp. ASV78]|uniref:hypothetical protein n=1 Tax=Pseudoalteromonas sp. ASV78 TaxID=3397851 RepID=UPI0039FB89E2